MVGAVQGGPGFTHQNEGPQQRQGTPAQGRASSASSSASCPMGSTAQRRMSGSTACTPAEPRQPCAWCRACQPHCGLGVPFRPERTCTSDGAGGCSCDAQASSAACGELELSGRMQLSGPRKSSSCRMLFIGHPAGRRHACLLLVGMGCRGTKKADKSPCAAVCASDPDLSAAWELMCIQLENSDDSPASKAVDAFKDVVVVPASTRAG